MNVSTFCTLLCSLTAEGGVVLAELSLAWMSLEKGLEVEEVYHEFIESGTLPKVYRANCTENSKATH